MLQRHLKFYRRWEIKSISIKLFCLHQQRLTEDMMRVNKILIMQMPLVTDGKNASSSKTHRTENEDWEFHKTAETRQVHANEVNCDY